MLARLRLWHTPWYWRRRIQYDDGPKQYKQMAISPLAHEKISQIADSKGLSIIDTVDKIMGVNR